MCARSLAPRPARELDRAPQNPQTFGDPPQMARAKIALIGAGMIGGTLAHVAAREELGDVILFDIAEGTPAGQGAGHRAVHGRLRLGGLAEGRQRLRRHRGRGRLHRHRRRAAQARHEPRRPDRHQSEGDEGRGRGHQGPRADAFVICITNPLDAMVWALQQFSGLPHEKVVGMAGVLDSSALRPLPLGKDRDRDPGHPRLDAGRSRRRHGADGAPLHRRRPAPADLVSRAG